MEMNKNIYTEKVTDAEKAQLENDPGQTEDQYLAELTARASFAGTSNDFERISDLQDLARIRGDQAGVEEYDKIMKKEYADIYDRMFNE